MADEDTNQNDSHSAKKRSRENKRQKFSGPSHSEPTTTDAQHHVEVAETMSKYFREKYDD